MKNFIFLIAAVFLLTSLTLYSVEEDCYVHVRIDLDDPNSAPGHLGWSQQMEGCDGPGIDCEIIPCDEWEPGLISDGPGGGHTLHTQLSDISVNRLVDGNWIKVTRGNGNNFTFASPYIVRIMSCTDASFVGVTLSLDGITTDNTGKYSVYMP